MVWIAEDERQADSLGAIQGFVEGHNEFLELPLSGSILVQTERGIETIIV